MRDRGKSLGVHSNLIWVVLGDFVDKIFRIDDFVLVYGEKGFFTFFFFSMLRGRDKNASYRDKKDTSITGLRMFVAFLVFVKAPAK